MSAGVASRSSRVAHAESLQIDGPALFPLLVALTLSRKIAHAVRAFVELWPARAARPRIGVSLMSGNWLLQYNADADKRGEPL